jgi:hypothetical protein
MVSRSTYSEHSETTEQIRCSSTVIDHLEQKPEVPVLYYYFNFRDESTQTCENFVRSITFQLLHYLEDIPDSINNLYAKCNSGSRRPAVTDLTTCLISIIQLLPLVYLLGDAFDECNQWNVLWRFITQLVKSESPSLRFMFTSRSEQHIQDVVNSLNIPSVNLTRDEMNRDIQKFVFESLDSDPRFSRILPEGKDLIREELVSRANGMYDDYLSFFCPSLR